jgi:hypothetical protein
MFRAIFNGLALALSLPALLLPQAMAAGKDEPAKEAATGSKHDLNPENWSKLHALIRPQQNEWRHLKVEWLTDVVVARKRAAADDKPILICYTGGAGYNEPLGVC